MSGAWLFEKLCVFHGVSECFFFPNHQGHRGLSPPRLRGQLESVQKAAKTNKCTGCTKLVFASKAVSDESDRLEGVLEEQRDEIERMEAEMEEQRQEIENGWINTITIMH